MGFRPGRWVYTLRGNRKDPPKGPFMMSLASQFNFSACLMLGRAGAIKCLFFAHMWALLGLGRIVGRGKTGGTPARDPNRAEFWGMG